MPPPATAAAPGLSSGAARTLAEIQAAPGAWTAEDLAIARGWDVRLTREDVAELRRLHLVFPDGWVLVRPGWAWDLLPAEDHAGRLVMLALEDRHRTVLDVARRLQRDPGAVRGTVERLVRAGVVWPLRRLVAR